MDRFITSSCYDSTLWRVHLEVGSVFEAVRDNKTVLILVVVSLANKRVRALIYEQSLVYGKSNNVEWLCLGRQEFEQYLIDRRYTHVGSIGRCSR